MEGRKEIQQAQNVVHLSDPLSHHVEECKKGLHAEESVFGLKGVVRKNVVTTLPIG